MEISNSIVEDLIPVRCPKCRRILMWMGSEALGVFQTKCFHNDCRKITDFLFYSGKVYIFNEKLKKRTDILNALPEDLKEIIINTVI